MSYFTSILFLFSDSSDSINFLGWDTLIWQIIIIPIILAIIELIKYLYNSYTTKKAIQDLEDSQHEKIEKSVNDIIDKTKESEQDKMERASLKHENKYVLNLIKKHLKVIRNNIGADRVWVGKFHNGEDNQIYPPNNPYQLFSILEESIDYGVSSQKRFIYNIPVVFYSSILEEVYENGHSYMENIDDFDNTMTLVMNLQGIKSIGAVAIKNDNGELKGVVGYDFIRNKKKLDSDKIEYIQDNTELLLEYIRLYQMYDES